jgi:hypothetical protein
MQDLLFYGHGELRDYFEAVKEAAKKEVEAIDTNSILNSSEEDFVRHFADKYSIEPPILDPDNKCISAPFDVDIDVSQDRMRAVFDRSRPCYVKGVTLTVSVPFTGDGTFFKYTPSPYTMSPPRGEVVGQEVCFVYQQTEPNAEELGKEISRRISDIQQYLGWVRSNIEGFNKEFEPFIREAIRLRKRKKLKDLDLVEKLGIPVRKREDMPRTYAIPEVKRKPRIARPTASGKPFTPEPALEMAEYENILSIVKNMALVLERSPSAFEGMKEEDLRQHFLIQLNAQYEGAATGETFNYSGKTDILIRHEGRNAFIAECKFWKGEKGLSEAIGQILKYTSWRDTKTAIILFNRGKNFSSVLEKIPGVVKAHASFKRDEGKRGETEFRFVLHQPDDVNRELILTVMAFNVPVPEKAAPGQ